MHLSNIKTGTRAASPYRINASQEARIRFHQLGLSAGSVASSDVAELVEAALEHHGDLLNRVLHGLPDSAASYPSSYPTRVDSLAIAAQLLQEAGAHDAAMLLLSHLLLAYPASPPSMERFLVKLCTRMLEDCRVHVDSALAEELRHHVQVQGHFGVLDAETTAAFMLGIGGRLVASEASFDARRAVIKAIDSLAQCIDGGDRSDCIEPDVALAALLRVFSESCELHQREIQEHCLVCLARARNPRAADIRKDCEKLSRDMRHRDAVDCALTTLHEAGWQLKSTTAWNRFELTHEKGETTDVSSICKFLTVCYEHWLAVDPFLARAAQERVWSSGLDVVKQWQMYFGSEVPADLIRMHLEFVVRDICSRPEREWKPEELVRVRRQLTERSKVARLSRTGKLEPSVVKRMAEVWLRLLFVLVDGSKSMTEPWPLSPVEDELLASAMTADDDFAGILLRGSCFQPRLQDLAQRVVSCKGIGEHSCDLSERVPVVVHVIRKLFRRRDEMSAIFHLIAHSFPLKFPDQTVNHCESVFKGLRQEPSDRLSDLQILLKVPTMENARPEDVDPREPLVMTAVLCVQASLWAGTSLEGLIQDDFVEFRANLSIMGVANCDRLVHCWRALVEIGRRCRGKTGRTPGFLNAIHGELSVEWQTLKPTMRALDRFLVGQLIERWKNLH